MSIDAGGLAQMTYNGSNSAFPPPGNLGAPGSGFGARSRVNSKRLSVALPPNVNSINENQVDNPTPRTSRSHLLAGLRTQPRAAAPPASAPYSQTQHQIQGLGASNWANGKQRGHGRDMPQTATAAGFDVGHQYGMYAGQQIYSLPQQVLAPPSLYEEVEEMDPNMLQQMQLTSLFLAQRQQQLQQQLANITAAAQGMNINGNDFRSAYQQGVMTPQAPQYMFGGQQQVQEVPGQPGVYLVYNPAINGYSYVTDPTADMQTIASPIRQSPSPPVEQFAMAANPSTPSVSVSPPPVEQSVSGESRSFTPPKKTSSPPVNNDNVEPLPPPSATAFRRGHHKKVSSLAINPFAGNVADGPKTASTTTFGTQRSVFPPAPMTGTFGPGAARAGEHPIRQPRGPPPLEELTSLPTSTHEGSKNFASRQRRRALNNLMRAGSVRRVASRSSRGSPVSERGSQLSAEDEVDFVSPGSCKMSPVGYEMKAKRSSQDSTDGYFGLSSASSSEAEDMSGFKQPPTPATAATMPLIGERKRMMLGVLNAAEKRKSFIM